MRLESTICVSNMLVLEIRVVCLIFVGGSIWIEAIMVLFKILCFCFGPWSIGLIMGLSDQKVTGSSLGISH